MKTVKVKGMSCQHCVASVKSALEKVEGVQNVQVDLQAGEARFDASGDVDDSRIKAAIEQTGFEVPE